MRTKMRTVAIIIVAIMTTVNFSVFSFEQDKQSLNMSYDVFTNSLSVEGSINKSQKAFINIYIVPYDMKETKLTNEVIANTEKIILKTFETNNNGTFSERIVMPKTFQGQRYLVALSSDFISRKSMVLSLDYTALSGVVNLINKGDKNEISALLLQQGAALGLGEGTSSENRGYVSDILYKFRPVKGYSENSFLYTYLTAEGLAKVRQKEINLEKMLSEYAPFADDDYLTMFDNLKSDEKQIISLLFEGDLQGNSFGEVFGSNQFVAQMRSSLSSMEMQGIFIEYCQKNNLSLSDYNSLGNTYYKDNVFNELYIKRNQMTSKQVVLSMFKEAVSTQKQAEEIFDGSLKPGGDASGGNGGGGTVNIVSNHHTDTQPTTEAEIFADMESHWAADTVKAMYELNIIRGFEDGNFKPEQNVTRAEFAKMVAMLLRLEENNGNSFEDVSTESWYAPYVFMVSGIGIIYGDGKNFYPENNITREDAAVILDRVFKYANVSLYNKVENEYADYDEISLYAIEAVKKLSRAEIISGYSGKFHPKSSSTRAEAATLLYRLSKHIK